MTSYDYETNSREQEQKEKSLVTQFRDSISFTEKFTLFDHQQKRSESGLSNLNPESQQLILCTVEKIKAEDCQSVIDILDETRNKLRSSYEEFKREQDECRKQFDDISKFRAAKTRNYENEVPVARVTSKKANADVQSDMLSNVSAQQKYQAHSETCLSANKNYVQHPTDKDAVLKYIRRRERRKRAEENKKKYQLSDDALEKKTAEIIQKMEVVGITLEHERQRQNEVLRVRMNEKTAKVNDQNQAIQIIGLAYEADLVRQQVDRVQRGRIEARLSAARDQRKSSNMIHVKSKTKNNDDVTLNYDQITTTDYSLQLFNEDDDRRKQWVATSIHGDKNISGKIPSVNI